MGGPININSQLRSIVERVERLEEDKKAVTGDLSEVYAEAKGNGFEPKIIRKVVRLRAQDKNKRAEEEALIDLYLSALGEPTLGFGSRPGKPADPELPLAGDDPAKPDEPEIPGFLERLTKPALTSPPPPDVEPDTRDQAAEKGKIAATAGEPITANPYPAGTSQRAVWDEAWCKASGTDGMDIPAALKPGQPKKPGGKK